MRKLTLAEYAALALPITLTACSSQETVVLDDGTELELRELSKEDAQHVIDNGGDAAALERTLRRIEEEKEAGR